MSEHQDVENSNPVEIDRQSALEDRTRLEKVRSDMTQISRGLTRDIVEFDALYSLDITSDESARVLHGIEDEALAFIDRYAQIIDAVEKVAAWGMLPALIVDAIWNDFSQRHFGFKTSEIYYIPNLTGPRFLSNAVRVIGNVACSPISALGMPLFVGGLLVDAIQRSKLNRHSIDDITNIAIDRYCGNHRGKIRCFMWRNDTDNSRAALAPNLDDERALRHWFDGIEPPADHDEEVFTHHKKMIENESRRGFKLDRMAAVEESLETEPLDRVLVANVAYELGLCEHEVVVGQRLPNVDPIHRLKLFLQTFDPDISPSALSENIRMLIDLSINAEMARYSGNHIAYAEYCKKLQAFAKAVRSNSEEVFRTTELIGMQWNTRAQMLRDKAERMLHSRVAEIKKKRVQPFRDDPDGVWGNR